MYSNEILNLLVTKIKIFALLARPEIKYMPMIEMIRTQTQRIHQIYKGWYIT